MKDKTGTKLCKYCQSEIPASAKYCPNCRQKQGLKIWQIMLIIVGIFLALSLFIGGSETTGPTSEGMSEGTKQEESNKDGKFAINEKINCNDVIFMVTDVKKYKSKEYETAKKGHEYVEVFINIENQSDEIYDVSSLNWKMENSKGQILEEAIVFFNEDNDFSVGSELKKGGKTSGSIVFEQPTGDKGLELMYYDNSFDDYETFRVKIK